MYCVGVVVFVGDCVVFGFVFVVCGVGECDDESCGECE